MPKTQELESHLKAHSSTVVVVVVVVEERLHFPRFLVDVCESEGRWGECVRGA